MPILISYSIESQIKHHFCPSSIANDVIYYVDSTYGVKPEHQEEVPNIPLDVHGPVYGKEICTFECATATYQIHLCHAGDLLYSIEVVRKRSNGFRTYGTTRCLRLWAWHTMFLIPEDDLPALESWLNSLVAEANLCINAILDKCSSHFIKVNQTLITEA